MPLTNILCILLFIRQIPICNLSRRTFMEQLKFDWQNDKLVLLSGFLGALIAVSMLFTMIFEKGLFGMKLFWLLIGAGIAGVMYFVITKVLTKYTAGFAFLALSVGGAFVHLLIGYGIEILMIVFLFVALVGLFGHFYLAKDPTILKITALGAGLYAFCHLLPFGAGGRLPLQYIFDLFKYSFFGALLGLLLLLVAIAVAVVIIMDMVKAQLPMPAEQLMKIGLFSMAGILVLQFLIGIFNTQDISGFMTTFFRTLTYWSIGIVAGFSFYVMKEGQEGKVLKVTKPQV